MVCAGIASSLGMKKTMASPRLNPASLRWSFPGRLPVFSFLPILESLGRSPLPETSTSPRVLGWPIRPMPTKILFSARFWAAPAKPAYEPDSVCIPPRSRRCRSGSWPETRLSESRIPAPLLPCSPRLSSPRRTGRIKVSPSLSYLLPGRPPAAILIRISIGRSMSPSAVFPDTLRPTASPTSTK